MHDDDLHDDLDSEGFDSLDELKSKEFGSEDDDDLFDGLDDLDFEGGFDSFAGEEDYDSDY